MARRTVVIRPDSAAGSLRYSKNYRMFKMDAPVQDAASIASFSDTIEIGSGSMTHVRRYVRYSYDGKDWSLWYEFSPVEYTPQMGDDVEAVSLNPAKDLYLDFKYEYDDGTYDPIDNPVIVTEIRAVLNLNPTAAPILLDDIVTATQCTSEFCPSVVVDREANFNPYDIDNFVKIYVQTSFWTNKTFGLPVVYFKTDPSRADGDYIFKEWNLYKTVDRKCIKVSVPNNELPDAKPHYEEDGISYETPFEVHIDKIYFESMFGTEAEPRKKDFLYFPMLNRAYEIQGAYLFRGLMGQPIYWKLQLVKFKPNINYVMRAEDTRFLDNLLLDSKKTFDDLTQRDIADSVDSKQTKTISKKFDESRLSISSQLKVREMRMYMNYTALIDYFYDTGSATGAAVQYRETARLSGSEPNMTFTCMFSAQNYGELNFIESVSGSPESGIRISGVYSGTTLTLQVFINGIANSFVIAGIQRGSWYGIVVSVSKEFAQIGAFVYSLVADAQGEPYYSGFAPKYFKVMQIADSSYDTGIGYSIQKSPIYIANIRVFNRSLRQEDHAFVLSQLFVQDESMLLLIDNCRPQLGAPMMARAR